MNKYKVQVIEDEINICNFMKMIFETHEYQATFSQRGESGLTDVCRIIRMSLFWISDCRIWMAQR